MKHLRKYLGYILLIFLFSIYAYAATVITADLIQLKPSTIPSSGNAGAIRYDSSANKAKLYNGSTWGDLGGGGSGGAKNYFSDSNETINSGSLSGIVNVYNSGGAYTDGTSGIPTSVGIVLTSTTGLLEGENSLVIQHGAADGSGHGVSLTSQTVDPQDYGRKLSGTIEIDFSGMLTSGDWSLKAYDITNSVELAVIGDDTEAIPNRKFALPFQIILGSTTASYRLSFHLASDSDTASEYLLYFDDIKSGPSGLIPGAIITPPVDFTPTFTSGPFTLGNGTIDDAYWSRSGSYMVGHIRMELGSTTNVGTYLKIDIPDGQSVDTTKLTVGNEATVGRGTALETGITRMALSVVAISSTELELKYLTSSAVPTSITVSGPHTWTTGDIIDFQFKIPISGWSAGASISTTEALFSTVKAQAQLSNNQAIAAATATKVTIDVASIDKFSMVDTSSNRIDIIKDGDYLINIDATLNNVSDGEQYTLFLYKNGSSLRRRLANSSATLMIIDIDRVVSLVKGDYLEVYVDSTVDTNYTVLGSADDFSIDVIRVADFSAFSVHGTSELIEAINSTQTSFTITAGTWGDLTSIILTPGEWDISALIVYYSNGATTTATLNCGVSTESGNSFSDAATGDNRVYEAKTTTTGRADTVNLMRKNVTLTETTTYYLKANASGSITNLETLGYKISARRIK